MKLKRWYAELKTYMEKGHKVLGMNRRNLDYIYPNNKRRYFEYANNKLLTKETLLEADIVVPKTFLAISYFYELVELENALRQYTSFVIKPASGSGGNGIMVISDRQDETWISVSGKVYTFDDIKKHIADIIFGVYSFSMNDTAIIEERIVQDARITTLSPHGLADIRVIIFRGENVKAMLRIATIASEGRANLHQGGIGVGIDLVSGRTFSAQIKGEQIAYHPDTGVALTGVEIPHWERILHISEVSAKAIPLEYLGIDIALSEKGPVVLEVNARPGIEIQNICKEGMRDALYNIDERNA
ncbi:MAG: sugar-transfer associated ATP-grasp domain-containing protein [Sulfurimonadaceae bacterium]